MKCLSTEALLGRGFDDKAPLTGGVTTKEKVPDMVFLFGGFIVFASPEKNRSKPDPYQAIFQKKGVII